MESARGAAISRERLFEISVASSKMEQELQRQPETWGEEELMLYEETCTSQQETADVQDE
jgi:hypothetical protein